MKESLLKYLICPECAGEMSLFVNRCDGEEIGEGKFSCDECRSVYPISGGIPRFSNPASDEVQFSTATNFGAQWLAFDQLQRHHKKQFLDWIAPVKPGFVRGKVVLEGGCGKGRHTRLISAWGAADVIGVDLSESVEVAYRNTKDLPNVHIIQADIYRLPLKQIFDYAFSVGVLHHLPDPRAGFISLINHVKPGGAISAWVYGRENNGWIVNLINPLRKLVTSKLPPRLLYYLSYLPASLLYLILKSVYLPLGKSKLSRFLFYRDYLVYIAPFPYREIHNIVHDHLTAPVAFYISGDEFGDWFQSARAQDTVINWHNRNSWRGFAYTSGVERESRRAEAIYAE